MIRKKYYCGGIELCKNYFCGAFNRNENVSKNIPFKIIISIEILIIGAFLLMCYLYYTQPIFYMHLFFASLCGVLMMLTMWFWFRFVVCYDCKDTSKVKDVSSNEENNYKTFDPSDKNVFQVTSSEDLQSQNSKTESNRVVENNSFTPSATSATSEKYLV